MAYTLGNKCAKNLCKRMVLLQLIIENVVTCFFGKQCSCDYRGFAMAWIVVSGQTTHVGVLGVTACSVFA